MCKEETQLLINVTYSDFSRYSNCGKFGLELRCDGEVGWAMLLNWI